MLPAMKGERTMSEQIDNAWSEMTKEITEDAAVEVAENAVDNAIDSQPQMNTEPDMG
jgi:hypothetical protein